METTSPSSAASYNKEHVIAHLHNMEQQCKPETFYNLQKKETIDYMNKHLSEEDVNRFVNVFKYPPANVNTSGPKQTGFLWCDDSEELQWAQNIICEAYDGHSGGSMACVCRWFEYALKSYE